MAYLQAELFSFSTIVFVVVHVDGVRSCLWTTPTGNKISGHRKRLSVTSTHRATKQLKLQLYIFQVVRQMQRDTAKRIQYFHYIPNVVSEGADM
jgi:hypothetical protein